MADKLQIEKGFFPVIPGLVLMGASLIAVFAFFCISTAMLWDMRLDTERYNKDLSRSLLHVLGRDIARNIEIYDLSLRAVVDGMKLPAIAQADPGTRQLILFDRAGTAENFGEMIVIDRAGKVSLSARPLDKLDINLSDRSYFKYFANSNATDLHIEGPIVSRFSGARALVFSRRISDVNGSFAGVVAGTIQLSYFKKLFASAGHHLGSITLYGPTGLVLMREPFENDLIGKSAMHNNSYKRILDSQDGGFDGEAIIGTGSQHFEFVQIGNYPLRLTISIPPHEIFSRWRPRALLFGSGVIIISVINILLIVIFNRELAKRGKIEKELFNLNDQLKKLAITDALTGLNNRGRFDEVLARDLRRCRRQDLPLSLILIDADFFKNYNDRYGHKRGDDALKMIAQAAIKSLGRASDTAHRIGGEEFAVVLPETDLLGASVVAQRIRETVAGYKMTHVASPHEIVTVSCGVAERLSADLPDTITEAADLALYEAKRRGRNCVHTVIRSNGKIRFGG